MIVQLNSGLGNQMFQYAFGKALEKHYGCKAYFDTNSDFDTQEYRKLELGVFNIDLNKANVSSLLKFNPLNAYKVDLTKASFVYKIAYRFFRKILSGKIHLFIKMLYRTEIIEEKVLCIYEASYFKLNNFKNIYFKGYYHNELFFKSIEGEIRNSFRLKNDYLSDTALAKEIKLTNSVSIHVRRGDYLNCSLFPNFNMDYYFNAITYLNTNVDNLQYFVFSDDIDWVRNEFKKCNLNFRFVVEKFSDNACDDMILMSFCKHNIIANSTYSWWAAWLNINSEKIVVAPLKWYADPVQNSLTQHLIPPKWMRM